MAQHAGANEVFFIFGAAGGIGHALCKQLSECPEIGTMVLIDHKQEKLQDLCSCLKGKSYETYALDAADPQAVERAFKATCEKYSGKPIGGVVNLIGNVIRKPLLETTPEQFMEIMKDNLVTSFNILKAAMKCMEHQQSGSVVFVSSAAAEHGVKHHEAWSAAKAGVEGLVKSAAASVAAKGIRVNCIAPGLTKTPETTQITESKELYEKSAQLYPMKRVAEPTEIASAIEFLLSKKASFITGQAIAVDGGLTTLSCVSESAR